MMLQASLLAGGFDRTAAIASGLVGRSAHRFEWLAGQGVVHTPRAGGGG